MIMDWTNVANEWNHYRAKIKARWGKLSSADIDAIAGDRVRLATAIRETYGIGSAEVENQIRYFEERNQNYRLETSSVSRWRSVDARDT